jgi:hypothetical protein
MLQTKIHLDSNGQNLAIEHVQDCRPILEHNKMLRTMEQPSDWGRHVAKIPNVVYVKGSSNSGRPIGIPSLLGPAACSPVPWAYGGRGPRCRNLAGSAACGERSDGILHLSASTIAAIDPQAILGSAPQRSSAG